MRKAGLFVLAGSMVLAAILVLSRFGNRPAGEPKTIHVVNGRDRVAEPATAGSTAAVVQATAMDDPVTDTVAASSALVQQLHAQLTQQTHNEATVRAQERLGSAMPAGLTTLARGDTVRVHCSDRMCELFGESERSPDSVREDLTNALWLDTLPRLGYTPGPISVVARNGRTSFLSYIDRTGAKPVR